MNDQAQFFVGWGTLSLINAGLAQSKNRSGLLWWIASLFFGPLATPLLGKLDGIANHVNEDLTELINIGRDELGNITSKDSWSCGPLRSLTSPKRR